MPSHQRIQNSGW